MMQLFLKSFFFNDLSILQVIANKCTFCTFIYKPKNTVLQPWAQRYGSSNFSPNYVANVPTGESPCGDISFSTHGYSVSLWEPNYMQREASGLSTMADGSRDLFLMCHKCAIFLGPGTPGLEY